MKDYIAKRLEKTHTFIAPAPRSKIFPLLCPVREYEWIEPWQCQVIYPESGVAENNCIFTTNHPNDNGSSVWVVSRYEKDERIEFVVVNAGHWVLKLNIRLEDCEDNTTRFHRTRIVTTLSEKGEAFLHHFEEHVLEEKSLHLFEKRLNH